MPLDRAPPPSSLMLELNELADASNSFVSALNSTNYIYDGFPKVELVDLANSLARLREGTAEGCRAPLEYARARLPAVRRIYFKSMAEDDIDEMDSRPARGLALDTSLVVLISATTTCLDQYRYLANSHFEDRVLEDEADFNVSSPDRSKSSAQSNRLDREIQRAITDAPDVPPNYADKRDALVRSLSDARNVNSLAKSEVNFSVTVVRWLRILTAELKNYPNIIRKFGRGISNIVDIVEPLRGQWNRYNQKLEDVTFEELREVGGTFDAIANQLERKRAASRLTRQRRLEDVDLKDWLRTFISERQSNKFGIPLTDVAVGIQVILKANAKELAKERGFKNLVSYLRGQKEFTVLNGLGTLRVSLISISDLQEDLDLNQYRVVSYIESVLSKQQFITRRNLENSLRQKFSQEELLFPGPTNSLRHLLKGTAFYVEKGRIVSNEYQPDGPEDFSEDGDE